MKQQQTFRGFMFIILMLILLMLALRFPYARQAQTVTAQEFEQILGSGNVAEAVISPNPQTPSGYVTVTLANEVMDWIMTRNTATFLISE
ncbi:MAG: ATP-dependent metallopeptidase FtsH/Yme1/Tma family protein, partial [Clostridium sp.]